MIVSDKWAQTTRSLRSLLKEEQADFKRRQLPFVTFSGTFTLRHNEHLVRHSGLLCFDFDHIGNETSVRDLQQRLIADPILNVYLAFRSPSGDGLKLVVKNNFTPENHNAKYAQLAQYIQHNYNTSVDHTNDIARACFLCHDPKAYIRQSTVYGQQSTEESRSDDSPQAEFKFNPYKNSYKQELESHRDDIIQAGVSTPANSKQTPEPRRGGRENSVGVTSVSSVERFRRSRELIKKEEKKSFKSVNQRSLSLWREKSVGDKTSRSVNSERSVREKEISICSPSSLSVESVERFSRSERANRSSELSVLSEESVGDKTSRSDKNSVRDKTLETAIQRIEQHHIDITARYHDWYRIGMALASHYGEAGRDYYHRLSRFYPHYTPQETNKQYDHCLHYNTHRIHLGTLFYLIQNTDNR